MVGSVIFMVAMVAHAAHALKAELVNGTVTVTIEDFDKTCESSRFIHHDEPKKMDDKCSFNSVEEGDTTKDTETLFRSMLDKLCPYVGYFPDKEFTEKGDATTKIDTFEHKYRVDDETTKTTLSAVYSNISDTTTIQNDSLNKTSVLTSTTESLIKPTNKSDEMITDTTLDSYVNVTDSISINKTESTSSTPKITEIIAANTTIEKLVILTTEKSIKSITEMTEKSFADSFVEDTTYDSSIDDTPPITEKENLTINDTIEFATETTKTTLNNTLMMDKNLIEAEDNTIATTTVKSVTLKSNNESTFLNPKYVTEEPLMKENMTSTTAIEKPISKSDIVVVEHELNTDNNETEPTSTEPSTYKTTAEIDYYEVDAESEYSTEINKTVVHPFSKGDNTSDYSSEEDTNESSTSYYEYQHTNDELIIFDVVTDFTTAKHDEDPVTTIGTVKTDTVNDYDEEYYKNLISSEDSHEIPETEGTTETTTRVMENDNSAEQIHAAEPDVRENNLNNKVTYVHDPNAVDGRRKIIVIVFGSILLVLSLIWAVKVLYRKYQGSYVLPQEGDNDVELEDSSTEKSTK